MNNILTIIKTKSPIHKKVAVPVSLRTRHDEVDYAKAKQAGKSKRPLYLEERLREWKHWALIANEFPYSAAFKVHHMLVPKRVTTKQNLTKPELTELDNILDELSQDYDCHMVNFIKKQSIQNHFHIHMLIFKDIREEMSF